MKRTGQHPLRSSDDRTLDDFDVAKECLEALDDRHANAVRAVRQFESDGVSPAREDLLVRLNADDAGHSDYSLGMVLNTLCKLGRLTKRPDGSYELGHGPIQLTCPILGSVS